MFKKWGAGMWAFLKNVRLVVQIAFPTTFYTGILRITRIKWVQITNNTATKYSSFIRIFCSIIDYINTLQTHLSWTCSYWIGAFNTNINLYYIIHNYKVHSILYHAWYDTVLTNTVQSSLNKLQHGFNIKFLAKLIKRWQFIWYRKTHCVCHKLAPMYQILIPY
jgi:hypothetical protein